MKKFTAGIIIAALILCAVILCAVIRFYPLFQAAQTLRYVAMAESIGYKADITLNRESFSKEQEQFLAAVAWILEVDEESCMVWNVSGYMSEGQGYAQVFCGGLDGVVTDAYFSGDYTVINVRMLYEALQKNFSSAHPILGKLLPDWKYSDYISLEQIEKIFNIDIKGMYRLDLPDGLAGHNIWQNLMLLHEMERHNSEDGKQQFEMLWNDYQMIFEVGKAGQTPELFIRGDDIKGSRTIASYRAEVSSGGAQEIVYPESVMEQGEIEQFQNLWGIIEEIQRNVREER